jgi:hypothetical protein
MEQPTAISKIVCGAACYRVKSACEHRQGQVKTHFCQDILLRSE